MHCDVGNFRIRQLLSEFLFERLDGFARELHVLRIRRAHLLQQRIPDIHVHAQAADGGAQMIDEPQQQFLVAKKPAARLLLRALHDGTRHAHEMEIVDHRSHVVIVRAVKAPRSQEMHRDVADLVFGDRDVKPQGHAPRKLRRHLVFPPSAQGGKRFGIDVNVFLLAHALDSE